MKDLFSGEKIVTAHEMIRIEGDAFARGESPEKFMDRAGAAIASCVDEFIVSHKYEKKIILLAGKGNNGGDAYVAGLELLRRGFTVEAFHLYSFDQCGPLCRAKADSFKSAGGTIHLLHQEGGLPFPKSGIILDGLVGTGFHGKPDGLMASLIHRANESGLPIVAVDIPSGLNGDTGEVVDVAIRATMTIYLGLLKLGFFLGQGYDHIGELKRADFGLLPQDIANAQEAGILSNQDQWPALLPRISRTQHKYQRGYVIAWAGSLGMPGAALLCCMGAFRAGAGIVRLYYDEEMESQLASAPWELIKEPLMDLQTLLSEAERAGCVVMGPGLGRTSSVGRCLKRLLEKLKRPVVLDADALYFLASHSHQKLPEVAILTPHRGELCHLLGIKPEVQGESFLKTVQNYVQEKQVIIVCKGAPTILFHPNKKPLFLPVGDPGMATAGSGDVLSGIIAALVASGLPTDQAVICAICLHGEAGEIAAKERSSRSVIASDLLAAIPKVYLRLESTNRIGKQC